MNSHRVHPYSKPKSAGGKNAPLSDQLQEDKLVVAGKQRDKKRFRLRDEDEEFLSAKTSKRILNLAHKQRQEENESEEEEEDDWPDLGATKTVKEIVPRYKSALVVRKKDEKDLPQQKQSRSNQSDDDLESEDGDKFEQEYCEDVVLDPEDELALERFMPADAAARRNIVDTLSEKFTEKKTVISGLDWDDASNAPPSTICPEELVIYKRLGNILKNYRNGKLPKMFKLIPKQRNWEEILNATEPEGWSSATMYQATRMFVSNLSDKFAQRFINLYLFPRFRDHVREYQKPNSHIYQALGKALFKQAAFIKGFLLPLCQAGDCTLREATYVSSVLARSHLPPLHSAAALMMIAEMEYTGANSMFMRTLLEKNCALTYHAVDAVVFHFLRFRTDKRVLPVLWHQCLLSFVVHYKNHISSEQKEALMNLLRIQVHHDITPEVRKELVSAKCRDCEKAVEPDIADRLLNNDLESVAFDGDSDGSVAD